MNSADTNLPFVILSLEVLADVAAEALASLDGFCLVDDLKDGNPPDYLPPRSTTPSLLRARIIWEVRKRLGEEAQREAERIIVDRDPRDPRRVRVMLPEQPGPRADRLFVPLTSEAFGWYLTGRKRWEVRRDAKRWGTRHVRDGRRCELRRGYSGPSLWGSVGCIVRGQLPAVVMMLGAENIVPGVDPMVRQNVIQRAVGLDATGPDARVVAFEVKLDPGQGVGE